MSADGRPPVDDALVDLFALGVDEDDARWLVLQVGVKDLLVVRGMVDGLLRPVALKVQDDERAWSDVWARGERIKQRLAELKAETRNDTRKKESER